MLQRAAPSSGTGDENTQYDLPTISGLSVQIPLGHYSHPVNGRKILNLSPLHLERITDMDESESTCLLDTLVAHVTNRQFSYIHAWQPDDMVLWDNWRTLHSALGYPLGDRRLVHRTTIGGDVQRGRIIAESPALPA